MSTADDHLFGRIAVHYKLISADQLTSAIKRQVAAGGSPRIGEVMLELKFITGAQLEWLLQAQESMRKQGGQAPPRPSAPASTGGSATALAPAAAPPKPATSATGAPKPSAPGGPARAPSLPVVPKVSPQPSPPSPPRTTSSPEFPALAQVSGPRLSLRELSKNPTALQALRARLPTLAKILARAVEAKASDVHIHTGAPLQMRISGVLKELRTGVLDGTAVELILRDALSEHQIAELEDALELDAALVLPEVGRFRASIYKQQRGWDGVFRPIPATPPTLEELGLPPVLKRLADYHQGLVLVTGPAGCGKSSTLAALVSMINERRHDHIITVEDPIEFVHQPKRCVVNQRQASLHTRSFANALKATLREDPDIIVIGELRDLETVALAITAAETGHLVLATLHTNNAIRTINRILDVFPPKQQSQIRSMVSESLRAIVSQRLLPTPKGGRVPVVETLFVKPSVSNLIREEKTFQIRSVMQTGRSDGMCLLDDALAELLKAGQITEEVARRAAEDPKRFS